MLHEPGFRCLGMLQFGGIPESPVEFMWPIRPIGHCPCAQQPAEAQQSLVPRRRVTQLKEGKPASEKETSNIQA